jgi:hypothetical protein
VLLPDWRVFLAGGIDDVDGRPGGDSTRAIQGPAELCATMATPRGYHSLPSCSPTAALMGGDKPGQWKSGETTHERYYLSYFAARPVITGAGVGRARCDDRHSDAESGSHRRSGPGAAGR